MCSIVGIERYRLYGFGAIKVSKVTSWKNIHMCTHLLIQSSLSSATGISTLFCQPCYQQPKEPLLFSVQSNLLSHALEVKMTSTKNDYNNPSTNVWNTNKINRMLKTKKNLHALTSFQHTTKQKQNNCAINTIASLSPINKQPPNIMIEFILISKTTIIVIIQ